MGVYAASAPADIELVSMLEDDDGTTVILFFLGESLREGDVVVLDVLLTPLRSCNG